MPFRLPRKMKSKSVIFVSALAIIIFGFVFVILALERPETSSRRYSGFLVGVAFVIWGGWALLSYKPENKP
jgi:putative Ca2+/H+ antiporter (TMEM165/GDT1 family)